MMIKIAPSILAADFTDLGREIKDVEHAGADYIHFDVMDGSFVPNISIGIPVIKSARKVTELPFDVHLMIEKPLRYVEDFCKAGADILTIHVESDSCENIEKTIDRIHALGKKAGLSVKPGTPVSALFPFVRKIELALIMTVEPGFGGQSLIKDMIPKIAELKQYLDTNNRICDIEVDGGISARTSALVKSAGANVLVAGTSIFGKPDYAERIDAIRNA